MKNILALFLVALLSFGVSAGGGSMNNHPRYAENPIYLIFEAYIQDVIGYLPEEKAQSIQSMNLQKVFGSKASEWRSVMKETLHLSDTIDIAILDLWYRNRDQFKSQDGTYEAIWFSQVFTDEYMKKGSQVDVWPEGALDAAKKRIQQAQLVDQT
ncbi:hypothetical protein [Photobacterium lipolyticum]|uniref:Uncharacterized protein n=1 Tax=Photobacterium lipolyticum TaxID=266810 RepID=A0A2T3MLZ3_9GAMM|nr:hypothetical protein [Photobacterium lipolyticum]PSV97486.1 hypothetical protein C9I89_22195 [Photobacterium lipolyticum]